MIGKPIGLARVALQRRQSDEEQQPKRRRQQTRKRLQPQQRRARCEGGRRPACTQDCTTQQLIAPHWPLRGAESAVAVSRTRRIVRCPAC